MEELVYPISIILKNLQGQWFRSWIQKNPDKENWLSREREREKKFSAYKDEKTDEPLKKQSTVYST